MPQRVSKFQSLSCRSGININLHASSFNMLILIQVYSTAYDRQRELDEVNQPQL